jgi:fatty acid synthase subunit alpha
VGGSAGVSRPTAARVFTGQGSHEPGMDMGVYSSSPAARGVWEVADTHLLATYQFSIVEILTCHPFVKLKLSSHRMICQAGGNLIRLV